MKNFKITFAALALVLIAAIAYTYNTKVYHEQGGDRVVVASGGTIAVEDGGSITTPVEVIAADATLTSADSGKTYIINATEKTVTLPSTEAGVRIHFAVMAISATTGFSISPAAADAIHYVTSTDDKDLINSAATDVEGDSVTLIGDGAEGWWVESITGTWAKE